MHLKAVNQVDDLRDDSINVIKLSSTYFHFTLRTMLLTDNIKRFRKANGLSQEYVSYKLSMAQPSYSRLEKNESACIDKLEEIARALDTNPETLLNYHVLDKQSLVKRMSAQVQFSDPFNQDAMLGQQMHLRQLIREVYLLILLIHIQYIFK